MLPYFFRIGATTAALLLAACVGTPIAETPIEAAQRRLPLEAPVIVADGCAYRRNLTSFNHYIVDDSLDLAKQGATELMAAFKEKGVTIKQFVTPVMCATNMPPRENDKDGRIAQNQDKEDEAVKLPFPRGVNDAVTKDSTLLAAYARLFEPCDYKVVRQERRYDCPLLSAPQAALLKARLKTSYVVALSVGGDRPSAAHRTGMAVIGLLLGGIIIPGDEGTVRVRVVNLDSGALIYSSFPGEFTGSSPADIYYEGALGSSRYDGDTAPGGVSRYEDLRLTNNWATRTIKPFFARQR